MKNFNPNNYVGHIPANMFRNGSPDIANKTVEIEVTESCAGITMYFTEGGDYSAPADVFPQLQIRVELQRKNQPNSTLYDLSGTQLKEIFGALNRDSLGIVLPFSLKDNLILGKGTSLKITVTWSGPINFDGMRYSRNYLATFSNVPVSVKVLEVNDSEEIDTEYYQYLLISDSVYKIETVINAVSAKIATNDEIKQQIANSGSLGRTANTNGGIVASSSTKTNTGNCCCDSTVERTKIELDFLYLNYLSSQTLSSTLATMETTNNQKVTLYTELDDVPVYLVQA